MKETHPLTQVFPGFILFASLVDIDLTSTSLGVRFLRGCLEIPNLALDPFAGCGGVGDDRTSKAFQSQF